MNHSLSIKQKNQKVKSSLCGHNSITVWGGFYSLDDKELEKYGVFKKELRKYKKYLSVKGSGEGLTPLPEKSITTGAGFSKAGAKVAVDLSGLGVISGI